MGCGASAAPKKFDWADVGKVKYIYSGNVAFAAVLEGGGAVTWGHLGRDIDFPIYKDQQVKQIYSVGGKRNTGFAAVLETGKVNTWGKCEGCVPNDVYNGVVTHICSTEMVFGALLESGKVGFWGPREITQELNKAYEGKKVKGLFSNQHCFAAVLEDGSVFTMGDAHNGGDSSSVEDKLIGVNHIFSTERAFAAVLESGAVVTWGGKEDGGDSSSVESQLSGKQAKYVSSTESAFAALLEGGKVVTWGDEDKGGDSSKVADKVAGKVKEVCGGPSAFAAVLEDGSVVAWGEHGDGEPPGKKVKRLFAMNSYREEDDYKTSFVVELEGGGVAIWGAKACSSEAEDALQGREVTHIYSNREAFAAVLQGGGVVTWGNENTGGDSSDALHNATTTPGRKEMTQKEKDEMAKVMGVAQHAEEMRDKLKNATAEERRIMDAAGAKQKANMEAHQTSSERERQEDRGFR